MDKLDDYFKNECKIDEPQLEDLSEYEIELLTNAINNVDIQNSLNDALSIQFFNLFGLVMENKKNYKKAKKYYLMAIKKNNIEAYYNFEDFAEKHDDYKSFINCHIDLIKSNNFTFVDEFNEFVDEHFNECLKYISKNAGILHKHLDILENMDLLDRNYCANCNECTLLVESNCNHNYCLACNNLPNKCLKCKKLLKKNDFENY